MGDMVTRFTIFGRANFGEKHRDVLALHVLQGLCPHVHGVVVFRVSPRVLGMRLGANCARAQGIWGAVGIKPAYLVASTDRVLHDGPQRRAAMDNGSQAIGNKGRGCNPQARMRGANTWQ